MQHTTDIPLVQFLLHEYYDPAEHFRGGELVTPQRNDGVVIVCGRFSFHDTARIRSGPGADLSASFNGWLGNVLIGSSTDDQRHRLLHREEVPAARAAYPREDHMIPFMVAVGVAREEGVCVYRQTDFMRAITISS